MQARAQAADPRADAAGVRRRRARERVAGARAVRRSTSRGGTRGCSAHWVADPRRQPRHHLRRRVHRRPRGEPGDRSPAVQARRAAMRDGDLEWQRRAATLGGILTSMVTVSSASSRSLMLLRELSIDVLPILTGAGIAGLAIGFGAQNLVRDVISGLLPDPRRSGAHRRSRAHQRRRRHRRADQPAHDRAARRRRRGAGVPERHDHGARESQQAVRVRDGRRAHRLQREHGSRDRARFARSARRWSATRLGRRSSSRRSRSSASSRWPTARATIRMKFKTQPLNQGKVANELRRRADERRSSAAASNPYA